MRKTITLPKVDFLGTGRRTCPVDIEIRLENGRLSICGNIWNHLRTDVYSGGQNLDTIGELFPDDPKVQRIVEVWRRWHLNDMRAGCEHQRAEGWGERPIDPSKPTNTYGRHFDGQRSPSWNLLGWVRPDEHPDGLLTRPCSECGYRYGTAWKTEEIPADVVDEIASW